jgi:hypothetical protein
MNREKICGLIAIIHSSTSMEKNRMLNDIMRSDEKIKEHLWLYIPVMQGFLEDLKEEIEK